MRIEQLRLPVQLTEVEYTSMHRKIQLLCIHHNELFLVTPQNLLRQKTGCNKCSTARRTKPRITTESFLTKAKKIHGDTYIYKDDYIDSTTKITIKCKVHGPFNQAPSNHLQGNGCPKCGILKTTASTKLSTKQFIQRVSRIFPQITFNRTHYVNSITPVVLTCPDHGDFIIKPDYVLYKHMGCPSCVHFKGGIYNFNFDWDTHGLKPGVFYILKIESDDESFYKVGISRQIGKKRISQIRSTLNPAYRVEVVYQKTGPLKEMWELEQRVLKRGKRYKPKQQFSGWTECIQATTIKEVL